MLTDEINFCVWIPVYTLSHPKGLKFSFGCCRSCFLPDLEDIYFFFFPRNGPPVGQGFLIHEVSRSRTTAQQSRKDSSGRVISSSQILLPDNTQHSQQTDIHAPRGIRTHNVSRRAPARRLEPAVYWLGTALTIKCVVFHIETDRPMHSYYSHHFHCVIPTCFVPQTAIFRE